MAKQEIGVFSAACTMLAWYPVKFVLVTKIGKQNGHAGSGIWLLQKDMPSSVNRRSWEIPANNPWNNH